MVMLSVSGHYVFDQVKYFTSPSCRHTSIVLAFKRMCTFIKASADAFSSHSFRRGGAFLAFRVDIEADKIQLLGDWHSEAYEKY